MTTSTATIITTNPRHPIFRNNFILFVNFILFCTVPLISCQNDGKGNGVDASGDLLRKHFSSSHNIQHSNSEWKSEKAENEETHPKLFAAYHESYITKAAAKDFRRKIRSHKKPITEQDYNDLLQEIVLKPLNKPKNDIYEKKYFDYLPADSDATATAAADDDDSNDYRYAFDGTTNDGDDSTGYDEFSDEENENSSESMIHKNRYKRDITDDSERLIQNEKRNAVWDQGQRQTAPLTFYISPERHQPINPFILNTAVYKNDLNTNNPWNNRFYGSQNLNRLYLPVAPPSAGYDYPKPLIPFVVVPGDYHNVAQPPQNPPVNGNPAASSTVGPITLDNRFGEPVWDFDELPQVNQNTIPSSNGKDNTVKTTTKRPSPSLIHNSDQERDVPRPARPQNNQGTNQQVVPATRPAPTPRPVPTTRRPKPSLIHNSEAENALDLARPSSSSSVGSNRQGDGSFFVGPSVGAPIWNFDDDQTQSNRPFVQPQQQQRPQQPQQIDPPVAQLGPSRCVWGIVNCCTRRDINIRYACFERIGCQGAFWDLNPCGDDILDAALNEADQYFN